MTNEVQREHDADNLIENHQPAWKIDQAPLKDGTGYADVLRNVAPFLPSTQPGSRFHEGFEDRCQKLGHAANTQIAVDYGDQQVTYATLLDRANQLAWYFKQLAIPAGARIALLLDRSIDSYAAVLAASKIGAAYVPLDASFPRDRILYMLEDSEVQVVLTLRMFTDIFEGSDATVLSLEDSHEAIAKCPVTPFDRVAEETERDPLAYLIYTSGSTGKPKGVPIRHSSICNFMDVATRLYGYQASDRVYQGLTIAFDFSFEEVWIPLFTGACLVPALANVKLVGCDLSAYLAEHSITALCCTPTMLSTLNAELPQLRFMLLSGEACPEDVVAPWLSPNRRILNVYGPTETTVTATWAVVEQGKPITIGGPLPTYDIVVVHPDTGKPVAQGETGEICIAGVGLCDDYLNRPEKTAQAFMPDMIGLPNNPSNRLYRTGDLGRINQQYEIEYLGRIDTQVKIRGYRIELEEIESIARAVEGVEQAVVQPFDIDGSKTLVAFLTPTEPDKPVDINSVFESLKTALPSYMVPAYYEQLDDIPVLPSGKTDRNALQAPTGNRFSAEIKGEMVKPNTPLESDLADVMAEVLNVDAVSVAGNFFEDLNADSLNMAVYVTAVGSKLGIDHLTMRQLYEYPTIQKVAAHLAKQTTQHKPKTEVNNKPKTAYDQHKDNPHIPSYWARYTMGTAQLGFLFTLLFLTTWLAVYIYHWVIASETFTTMYLRTLVSTTGLFFGMTILLIAIKWLVIGKLTPEPVKVWSVKHFRLWVAELAVKFNPLAAFIGTPIYNTYLRWVGAKIGKDALVLSSSVAYPDMLSIGKNTVIRDSVYMPGYTAANGYLYPGHIEVGENAVICEDTVLEINSRVGNHVQIGLVSTVEEWQTIPDNSVYQGTPAEPSTSNFDHLPASKITNLRKIFYVVTVFTYSALVASLGFTVLNSLIGYGISSGHASNSNLIIVSSLLFFASLLFSMAYMYVVPRIVQHLVQTEKVLPRYGIQFELAKWMNASTNNQYFNRLFGDSALILGWLSIVGYDLKEATQTGSNFGVEQKHNNPFKVKFGSGTMVADGLSLLNTETSITSFMVRQINVPADTYFGNSLFYPSYATSLGNNCLIGTKTAIPVDGKVRENTGLVGSPAFEIPRNVARDTKFDHFKEPALLAKRLKAKLHYNLRTIGLFLIRGLFFTAVSLLVLRYFSGIAESSDVDQNTLFTALELTGSVIVLYLMIGGITILTERMVYGFKPIEPEYCSIYEEPFWQHERFWKLAADDMIKLLDGTPFKSWVLRMQGAKVGKGLFDNGCAFAEPNMVSIGDHCTFNSGAYVQCHSLENGALKSDRVNIQSNCTLGTNAFIQYGTVLENQTYLSANANLMKGATIETGTIWAGNPARKK